MRDEKPHILIIKLGALGDFIQAVGLMRAIRNHHADATISLLTTAPYAALAEKIPYIDHVLVDKRPRWYQPGGWLYLRNLFRKGGFTRIYDLQNNDRTAFYMRLSGGGKGWVGRHKGAGIYYDSTAQKDAHMFDIHMATLAKAGIHDIEIDDLSWAGSGDLAQFWLADTRYALLIPGASARHPEKCWPALHYAQLARTLSDWGYKPVIIGSIQERTIGETIRESCPDALDLTGQTDIFDIAFLARHACVAIGNDTGPMHIVGAAGCPCLVLFSRHSTPHRHKPRGHAVQIVQKDNLADLTPAELIAHLRVRDFRCENMVGTR